MKWLIRGIEVSHDHKAMAGKFFVGWLTFLAADTLFFDQLVGWLRVATHVFLAGGAALSFWFWLRRLRREGRRSGNSGANSGSA